MESIQAWLNDKKNLPIIAGALAAMIVVALAVVFLTHRSSDTGAGTDESAAPIAPAPGAPPSAPTPGGVAPAAPDATQPQTTAAPAPATPAPGAKKEPPLEAYRSDPFRPFYGPKPKRAKPVFMAKLTRPDIRRVAPVIPGQGQVEAVKTLGPQPQRRMAGILKNNRVYAIIEGEGETKIVKAGDIFNADLMVDRITNDKVILRSTNTTRPEFVEVPRSPGPPRPPLQSTNAPTPDTGAGRRGGQGRPNYGGPRAGPGGPGLEGAPPPPGP